MWRIDRLWNRWLGKSGEHVAARFLRSRGIKILKQNYSSPVGEIDLIGLDRETLVFVEVKTRSPDSKGRPEEAVTIRKQKQITQTAVYFLKRYRRQQASIRFDVVAITWPTKPQDKPTIDYFPAAFPGTSEYFL